MPGRDMNPNQTAEEWENSVREVLSDTYTDAGVEMVMRSRNKALGSRAPRELISMGFGPEVLAWAESLERGGWRISL